MHDAPALVATGMALLDFEAVHRTRRIHPEDHRHTLGHGAGAAVLDKGKNALRLLAERAAAEECGHTRHHHRGDRQQQHHHDDEFHQRERAPANGGRPAA